MRKIIAKIGFLLLGLALLMPVGVFAAYNTVQFPQASDVLLTGPTPNITLTVSANSNVNSITVYPAYISVVLERDATDVSSITFTSNDRYNLNNSAGTSFTCGTSTSTLTLTGPAAVGTSTVSITPATTVCSSTGGVSAGVSAPAPAPAPAEEVVPAAETAAGEGTVTAAEGGSVTATTDEGGEAKVEVPANAVVADTVITITPVGTAESIAGNPPAGSFMVGGYVYTFTATADGEAVTTFSEELTLTFTYTDDQISGLDESTLIVYRWDADVPEWVALDSAVDVDNNTVTAATTQFSEFALMGEEAAEEVVEEEEVVKPISEMTVAELKAEIARIAALIAQLQAQLAELIGVPAGQLNVNLKYGDRGDDVELLQTWLAKNAEVYPEGVVSGWFGPLTKAAVIRFQEKYAADVLTPWNLTAGTGFVGSTTREKLNALYAGQ